MKYRQLQIFILVFILQSLSLNAQEKYKLVWSDEFNKKGGPDTTKWDYERGFVCNEELQWYQPENAYVKKGELIIEARRETSANPNYTPDAKDWRRNRRDIEYTSSCLITRGKQQWLYGRFVMRARIDINAVNPSSKDYLKWTGGQPLVDASFFAFGLVRCPWLWNHLDTITKRQVINALKQSRSTIPVYSNWILFSAMLEAFFCKYGLEYEALRIEYAVREFAQHWYIGDGTFSDGMQYHDDYYNSYVIQPYLAAVVSVVNKKNNTYSWLASRLDQITKRYAEIQERAINADGTFSVTGRSITYRAGAFHHLADMALRKQLAASLPSAQVRSALMAVIKKTIEAPSTFTKDGWLNIGLHGYQPDLAESYINTGSVYLCTTAFLPLGLSETDEFWSSPSVPWTSVKVWSGQNSVTANHALDIPQ